MPLHDAACPLPGFLRGLVKAYISNDAVALAVSTLVGLAVLVVAELLVSPLVARRPWLLRRLWLLRGAAAAGLVLVHEYVKEGYWFKVSDLTWPPRSHEAFTVFVVALSALLRGPLVVRSHAAVGGGA